MELDRYPGDSSVAVNVGRFLLQSRLYVFFTSRPASEFVRYCLLDCAFVLFVRGVSLAVLVQGTHRSIRKPQAQFNSRHRPVLAGRPANLADHALARSSFHLQAVGSQCLDPHPSVSARMRSAVPRRRHTSFIKDWLATEAACKVEQSLKVRPIIHYPRLCPS